MKRARRRVLISVTTIIAICIVYVLANPLLRTDNYIRKQLLKAAPLGSSMGSVREFIESKHWKIAEDREDIGFMDQRYDKIAVVGAKHIQANMGYYHHGLFKANVTVFWGFDRESRLIDVWVWRTIDAL